MCCCCMQQQQLEAGERVLEPGRMRSTVRRIKQLTCGLRAAERERAAVAVSINDRVLSRRFKSSEAGNKVREGGGAPWNRSWGRDVAARAGTGRDAAIEQRLVLLRCPCPWFFLVFSHDMPRRTRGVRAAVVLSSSP